MFGGSAFPFYVYNVASSFLSVLFSEPRAGIWSVTRGLVQSESSVAGLVNVVASTLGTCAIAFYVWHRRTDWWARRFNRDDQLVIVFIAVALANAAISYAYTKDVILSPAGAFFALALTVGVTHVLESLTGATARQQTAALMLLLVLSGAWAFRAVGIHVGLRESAAVLRNEWAYVDDWLEREHQVPTDPRAIELKRHLQNDAISEPSGASGGDGRMGRVVCRELARLHSCSCSLWRCRSARPRPPLRRSPCPSSSADTMWSSGPARNLAEAAALGSASEVDEAPGSRRGPGRARVGAAARDFLLGHSRDGARGGGVAPVGRDDAVARSFRCDHRATNRVVISNAWPPICGWMRLSSSWLRRARLRASLTRRSIASSRGPMNRRRLPRP